jgi:hypothetical protein
MKEVDIYSFKTEKKTRIPAAELSPGYLRCDVPSVGIVYVQSTELHANTDTKPLPEGFDRLAKATLAMIKSGYPQMDEKRWVDGFRGDMHPVRELFGWMRLACVFHGLTHGGADSPEIQRDVFRVCLQTLNNGDCALETVELSCISRARAKTCMQRMLAHTADIGPEALEEEAQFWAGQLSEEDTDTFIRLNREGDGPSSNPPRPCHQAG